MNISHFKVYCITESAFIECYGTSEPTACPNNNTHTINPNSVQTIVSQPINMTVIQEESGPNVTGGHFGAQAYTFTAAPNTTTTFNSSFPYPISILTCQFQASQDMVGDTIDFAFNPQTVVGVLNAPVMVGSNIVTVTDTVAQYSFRGMHAQIAGIDQGRITAITNNTVSLEIPFAATTAAGAPFSITRFLVKDYYLATPGVHQIGFSKIGGGFCPVGTVGQVIYTNTTAAPKVVSFVVEHLY
jgi:hypothetical protein